MNWLSPLWRGSARILLVLGLIVAGFATLRFEAFTSLANLRNIGMSGAILLVMGVGATFVLVTAGVDLSVGAVLVFSGVIADLAMTALGAEGWVASFAGLAAACVSGLAWGVLNGVLVAKAQIPPLVATLGTMGAAQGLAWIIAGEDLKDVPEVLGDTLGVGDLFGVPVVVIVAAIVTVLGGAVLQSTRFGRHTLAIGSNAVAAREMGIAVDRHLIAVYGLAGGTAGLAGLMSLARYGSTTMGGHATDNLAVIAAVVIGGTSLFGGRGSVFATAVGVLILGALANILQLNNISAAMQLLATGAIIVAAAVLQALVGRRDGAGR